MLSQGELITGLQSAEEALTTLCCDGHVEVVCDEDFKAEFLVDPSLAAFDSSWKRQEIQWAFEGSPVEGRFYARRLEAAPHYEPDPTDASGAYRLSGLYANILSEEAFDGECYSRLTGRGMLHPVGEPITDMHMVYSGQLSAERPVWEPLSSELGAYTPWALGTPLSKLLKNGIARYTGCEKVGGVLACVVEADSCVEPCMKLRVWLDPARAFAVVRRERIAACAPGGPTVYDETLSVQLKEWAPGVWLPQEVVFGGKLPQTIGRLVLTDVRVNEPLDASLFAVAFPAETDLTDSVRGIRYTVGQSDDELEQGVVALTEQARAAVAQ